MGELMNNTRILSMPVRWPGVRHPWVAAAVLAAAGLLLAGGGVAWGADDTPVVVAAEKHGFAADRLARIAPVMQRYVDQGKVPGVVTVIARHGAVVHFEAVGKRSVARGLPMEKDTIFRLYSQSKPVTGAAVMILYEEGRFLLTDAVASYLPEFANSKVYAGEENGVIKTEPARPMTIQHLLTHTSGLTYGFFPSPVGRLYQQAGLGGISTDRHENLEHWTAELAKMPLVAQPGTAWNYSVGMDVLGRLVEKVSGQRFGDFLRQRIFDPLGMVDTGFSVPDDKLGRFAANYSPTPEGGMRLIDDPETSVYRKPPKLEFGGSGLVGTAGDYLRFALMLANGGELDGRRILSPTGVRLMMSNHLGPALGDVPLASLFSRPNAPAGGQGLGFGLTGMVITDPALAGLPGPNGVWGWGGAATTHFYVDPEHQLVALVMTQLLPDGTYPLRQVMQQMTYQALIE